MIYKSKEEGKTYKKKRTIYKQKQNVQGGLLFVTNHVTIAIVGNGDHCFDSLHPWWHEVNLYG